MIGGILVKDPRCPECKDDGKCVQCNGTGINIHINEAEPKCSNCAGTGICPTCECRWSEKPKDAETGVAK